MCTLFQSHSGLEASATIALVVHFSSLLLFNLTFYTHASYLIFHYYVKNT